MPQAKNQEVRTFTLTAQVARHELKPGTSVEVWAYNGSVPGPELRVQQGQTVRITLKNELPESTTIHWHGIRVPNPMDGVPGVTQDAVPPGQTFTYEFVARDAGTYWYHPHFRSAGQVDMGLYGAFIVEPQTSSNSFDRPYTLVLDEWATGHGGGGHGGHGGHNIDHGMSAYNLGSINGKSGSAIPSLEVKQGESVKLRLINAGFFTHQIHLHGHTFTVTDTDGQPIPGAQPLRDTLLPIAPGERYDLAFIADNLGTWLLESHDQGPESSGMQLQIKYSDAVHGAPDRPSRQALPLFSLTEYGEKSPGGFDLTAPFDKSFVMEFATVMVPGQGEVFTINGKSFPEIEPLSVSEGDRVKVRFMNNSNADHPMHLHGHSFQLLSFNGQPLTVGPIWKDTLNIRPGQECEIAFVADNPGNWMFHCHELHHAAMGMMVALNYEGYQAPFTPDPNLGHMPE